MDWELEEIQLKASIKKANSFGLIIMFEFLKLTLFLTPERFFLDIKNTYRTLTV